MPETEQPEEIQPEAVKPKSTIEGMQITISQGGWKAILLKFALYVMMPLIGVYLLFCIIYGTISPKVALEIVKGKNRSDKGPKETPITVEHHETNINVDIDKEEVKSYDYITRVLEGLK